MIDPSDDSDTGAGAASVPRPIDSGLRAACPRCGAPTLFAGWIRFADRCASCGLDYTRFNVGDGPAAFLTLILGTIVVVGAVALELTLTPPWWVHVILWTPLTVLGVVLSLRLAKGWLLALEYRNDAAEAGSRR